MYSIKGFIKGYSGNGSRRYIQFHQDSGNPVIKTKTAYRRCDQVLFETEQEAWGFLYLFMNSKNRKNMYDYDWEVKPYKPTNYFSYWGKNDFTNRKQIQTEYGNCYRMY